MNVKVTRPEREESKYPYFGVCGTIVVLFTKPKTGVEIVNANSQIASPNAILATWNEGAFTRLVPGSTIEVTG